MAAETPKILREEEVLDNDFFAVVKRTVTDPDGKAREQLVWDRRGKGFSAVVVRTGSGEFLLVQEPKYGHTTPEGTLQNFLTIPTGGIKKGEAAEVAARRELLEEAGYIAEELVLLRGAVVEFPDKIDGGDHNIFLADNATKVQEPEGKVILVTRKQLEELVDGKTIDEQITSLKLDIAMSMLGIVLALRYLDKNEQE